MSEFYGIPRPPSAADALIAELRSLIAEERTKREQALMRLRKLLKTIKSGKHKRVSTNRMIKSFLAEKRNAKSLQDSQTKA
jgi:hypothetical protein